MILKIILVAIAVIAGYLLFMILIGVRILRKFVHFPAPAFIFYFLDSKLRKRIQPANLLIERSGVKAGMNVLELGCGSGAYTIDLARAISQKGNLHSLDIQQIMLDKVRSKLLKIENTDVKNVKLILGNAYELPFQDQLFDLILFITVLQEIPDKHRALIEAKRVLKDNGRITITELLVDPDYQSKKTTITQVEKVGFTLEKIEGTIMNYTIRFKKAKEFIVPNKSLEQSP